MITNEAFELLKQISDKPLYVPEFSESDTALKEEMQHSSLLADSNVEYSTHKSWVRADYINELQHAGFAYIDYLTTVTPNELYPVVKIMSLGKQYLQQREAEEMRRISESKRFWWGFGINAFFSLGAIILSIIALTQG